MKYLKTYKVFESNLNKFISDWRKSNSNLDNDFIDHCTPGITRGDEYTHKKWTLALIFGTSLIDSYHLDKNHPLVIEYKVRVVEGEDPLNVIEDVSKRVPGIDPNDFLLTRLKELKGYNESLLLESSGITKAHLVDRIKWYSNNLHQYMKDVNKYTTSNLNFSFSYDTELTISQIFDAADKLEHDSPDGFITAVCNEFITWSEFMTNMNGRILSELPDYRIDKGYEHFTDEYKQEHRHELYGRQHAYWMVYAATGRDLKESIAGTIWDIPTPKKEFTHQDTEFIIDSILSDYDVDENYIEKLNNISKFSYTSTKRGIIYKIPHISREGVAYGCDFIHRLQSYFTGGVLILDRGAYGGNIRLYLPFYK